VVVEFPFFFVYAKAETERLRNALLRFDCDRKSYYRTFFMLSG
jgi:hypothetical protein